jgi:hypothetical protein
LKKYQQRHLQQLRHRVDVHGGEPAAAEARAYAAAVALLDLLAAVVEQRHLELALLATIDEEHVARRVLDEPFDAADLLVLLNAWGPCN